MELLFPDVRLEGVASRLVDRFLEFRAMQHDMVEWVVPYHVGWKFREGDIVELTVDRWTDEPMILLEKHYEQDGIRQMWWRIDA